jgi:flagellar biosynthesis/type III secretory pathway chaperone
MLNLEESAPVPNRHEQIIDALRSEMQEYGGLLNLFDRQQNAILNRNPDEVTDSDQAIDAQLAAVRARRLQRENLVAALTPDADPHPSLLQAILHFPQPMRPLVEALATEVNRLIGRVRRRAQQNQMLLARTIEVAQELCEKLKPGTVTRTYAPDGKMKIKAAAGSGRLLEHS